MRSSDDERQAAVAAFERGLDGLRVRVAADHPAHPDPGDAGHAAAAGGPAARPLHRAEGRAVSPAEQLSGTIWTQGTRILSDVGNRPVRPEEIPVGGLVNGIPANLEEVEHETGNLNARAKAAIILVRMRPEEIVSQQGEGWDYQGVLAFSKICTHVGCPISLYEQRTHHLLCPCHQSTFDLADSGNVVFGPAARAHAAAARSRWMTRATWSRRATSTNPSDLASGSADECRDQGRRQGRRLAGGPPAQRQLAAPADEQGLPRPLVVHARRDRAVLVHRRPADRRVPHAVVQPVDDRGRVRRLLRPAQGRQDERVVRLGAAHLVRRPRRACCCARSTTGRRCSSWPRSRCT